MKEYCGYIYLNKLYKDGILHYVYCGYHKFNKKELDETYFGSGSVWSKKLNKNLDKDNVHLERIIIDWFHSKEEMSIKEKFWVKFYKNKYYGTGNDYRPNGDRLSMCLNVAEGGEGGCNYNYSQEAHDNATKKISDKKKNRDLTAKEKEALDALHEFNRGKHHSEESKEKSRKSNVGQKRDEIAKKNMSDNHADVRGEKNPAYGRHYYNNGEIQVYEYECPEGFVEGKLPSKIKRGSEAPCYGKKCYNNGVINVFRTECPEGFVEGGLPKKKKK